MKLLREMIDYKNIDIIKEDVEDVLNPNIKKRIIRLRGPMLGSETKNRNGRIYPKHLIEREIKRYNEERIKTGSSRGECGHPDSPEINFDRISHIIESLVMEGNEGIGVAKLIDTPCGRILETLVLEGQTIGMSTRGVGSLDGDIVKDDYLMCAIDAVDTPSYSPAMMESILENKEWIIQGDKWVELAVSNLQKSVDKKYNSSDSQLIANYLTTFINQIKIK